MIASMVLDHSQEHCPHSSSGSILPLDNGMGFWRLFLFAYRVARVCILTTTFQ